MEIVIVASRLIGLKTIDRIRFIMWEYIREIVYSYSNIELIVPYPNLIIFSFILKLM